MSGWPGLHRSALAFTVTLSVISAADPGRQLSPRGYSCDSQPLSWPRACRARCVFRLDRLVFAFLAILGILTDSPESLCISLPKMQLGR